MEMKLENLLALLGPQTFLYILLFGLFVLLIWNSILEIRIRRITKGADGKNIENHLATISRDYQDLDDFKKTVKTKIAELDTRLQSSIRGTGIVRFNPFAGSGDSKPSFATAFINEQGDGFILSTLHARNSVSIYCKDILNFKSEKELTEEEEAALEKATHSLHT
tara:strand:+ start:446 stop:940 length:495 start_codon:yes stop_codon:yes gene_type:complete